MEKVYLAWLHYIWFTHKKLHFIFWTKQNYKEVFENINSNNLKKYWFLDKQVFVILERYKKLKLDFLQKKLDLRKAKIITIFDLEYPKNLKEIFNPPFLFYLRWKIDNSPKIAIIGSRKISSYWEKVCENIITGLVKYFWIISWGAAWCDTKAHIETLKNNWKTISIIWTWIDQDYPVWNEKLFSEIVDLGWAIVSIFPIWEVWNPYNFPVRNEIVAGLSEGILIVEAREKSGSLITAKLWLDMWKDLFAIPWEIFRWGSAGTNNLIKNWEAKLVNSTKDILDEYNIFSKNEKEVKKISFSDELEKNIYNVLILESLIIDDLAKKMNLDISTISFKISMMEIAWLIQKKQWWKYEIK